MAQESLEIPIRDRVAAGQALARLLDDYRRNPNAIVLALPRGGVPVAYEIATALELPLDLMLVRKLGVPGHEELAMGAIASGDVRVLNRDVVDYLHIGDATIDAVAEAEGEELRRRDRVYRGERPFPALGGNQVIIVDDGLATGSTMQAAVEAVRRQSPARIVVAVPVGAPETVLRLQTLADEVVCPFQPEYLSAIGRWYVDFSQTTDEEVLDLLHRAWQQETERSS